MKKFLEADMLKARMKPLIHNAVFAWLPVSSLVAFILLRSFFLGFYHDDWVTVVAPVFNGGPWSLERLQWISQIYISRPGTLLTLFVLSSINGMSPLFWHLSTAVLSVLTALFVANFLKRLAESFDLSVHFNVALFFALLFFILPWTTGIYYFLTQTVQTFATMIFFALSGICALNYLFDGRRRNLLLAVLYYLLCCLSYEAFYFQAIPLAILLAMISWRNRGGYRRVFNTIVLFLVAQGTAIAWNRYTDIIARTYSKQFDRHWFALFVETLQVLPSRLAASFSDMGFIAQAAFNFYFLVVGVSLVVLWHARKDGWSFVVTMIAIGTGIAVSVFVYALAGYGITGTGVFSRTTLTPSFYIITAFFMADRFFKKSGTQLHRLYRVGFIGIFLILMIGAFYRLEDWATVWQIEKTVIAAAPIDQIKATDPKAVIVYKGPTNYHGVTIFEATWDINGAINYSYNPASCGKGNNPVKCNFRQYTVDRQDWTTVWKPDKLTQIAKNNGSTLWTFKASEAWLWDYYSKSFTRVSPGDQF